MPRAWFPFLGLICAAVLAQPVRSAEIWVHVYEQEPRALGQLFVLGEIDPGDIDQLGINIAYAKAEDIVLTHAKLYSSGGDVATALVIGRELRKLRITTIAPHHPQYIGRDFRGERRCVSDDRLESIDKSQAPVGADDPSCACAAACAVIWFSGVERAGSVGLRHLEPGSRPTRASLRNYLDEIGMPDWIQWRIATADSGDDFVEAQKDGLVYDGSFLEYLAMACGPGVSDADRTRYAVLLRWAAAEMTKEAEEEIAGLRQRLSSERLCRAATRLSAQIEAQTPPG